MAPPKGHTFRCNTPYQVPRASTSVAKGDAGVINRVSTDGTLVDLTIYSRPGPNVAVPSVPLANLIVGARFLSDTESLPVVLTGPLLGQVRLLPPGNAVYQNDNNPFRRAISYFLAGVRDNRSRIPHLNVSHQNLIDSDQSITITVDRFLANVQRVNPQFINTYGKQGTTIDEITPTLQRTNTDDHDAGIYLVILDQFRKRSSRFGLEPHAYVGKSVDIGTRIQSHTSTANGNDEGQEVHKAMREADRHRWFKLASHAADEGISAELGNAMRDVMESTFMMLFGTMSSRVMVTRVRNNDDMAKNIAENYDKLEMAKVFTDLSVAAFEKAGYFLPSSRNRTRPFGLHRYGCNVTISLGGESFNFYERTMWVRQDRGDQYTFHRSPLKFLKHAHLATMNYTNNEKSFSLIVQPTREEIEDLGIKVGDEYHMIWEVKKQGAGTHPVSFVRLSDIGCWSNWSYANKVALKIVFFSRKDKKWKTRYLQRQAQHHFVSNCTAPGAHADYSLGVGLYCFFMRCRFPDAQPWTAFFGSARIVTYTVDSFAQTIYIAHLNASADTGLRGPVFRPDVARKQMEDLGLRGVNAAWKALDYNWTEDPTQWKDGEVGTPQYCRGFHKRTKCDFCLFSSNSIYSGINAGTNVCKQINGTNICEPCAKTGRPCSWTDYPTLLGVDTWLEQVEEFQGRKIPGRKDQGPKKRWSKGDMHKAIIKALFHQPLAKNAVTTAEIDETTGKISTVGQQEQEVQAQDTVRVDRHDLDPQQQIVFDQSVERFMGLIRPMEGMDRSSDEYQDRMGEIATLVSSVPTATTIPEKVRDALQYFISQNILPFMINGVVPNKGG